MGGGGGRGRGGSRMSEFISVSLFGMQILHPYRDEQGHKTSCTSTLFHICWKLSVSRCQSSLKGGLYHLISSPVFFLCQLFSLQCNPRIELNAQDMGNGSSLFGIQAAQTT